MRIVIVKLSSIGDVVHALPAAALLKRSSPDAHITWVVDRRAGTIIKDSPVIDQLIELDTRTWSAGMLTRSTIGEVRAQLKKLRHASGDDEAARGVAIDFQGLIKSGLVAFASRAPRRIGFEASDLREKASRLFLTEQIDTSMFKHVIEKNLALARAAIRMSTDPAFPKDGLSGAAYEFPITVSGDDQRFVEQAIDAQRPFALVNPGGGWPTKLWPGERYAEIADWLWGECGVGSLITYGPGEEALARTVASATRSGAVRPLASTLKQFVALARRAALFVGGDTGPLHLAAASGAPIVGLYGPTSPERNGPFDPRDVTVGRDLWCRADCHRRRCWHWSCMDIPIDDVKRAILERLTRARKERTD